MNEIKNIKESFWRSPNLDINLGSNLRDNLDDSLWHELCSGLNESLWFSLETSLVMISMITL